MKTRLLLAVAGLAICSALPTFGQQKEKIDPQIIEQLNAIAKKYNEAINNHDAAAMGALFTEDAIFVTNTGPVYGREAIEKWYADGFKAFQPKNNTATVDPHSVRMLGPDNLTNTGDWSETDKGKNGEDVPSKGYWTTIDTRQGDAWKICVMTWNITPAPAATPSPTTAPSNQ
jgi:uncharacterized protein (TIGR02246 family)